MVNSDKRKHRGRIDRSVIFPVASPIAELPPDYAAWLADLKQRIQHERLRIVLASNSAMVLLYWDIGQRILEKQNTEGWGGQNY